LNGLTESSPIKIMTQTLNSKQILLQIKKLKINQIKNQSRSTKKDRKITIRQNEINETLSVLLSLNAVSSMYIFFLKT